MKKYLIMALVATLLICALKYLYDKNIELRTDNKTLEKINEGKQQEINSYTSRPRSDDDVLNQLCEWAASIDLQQGKSKREVRETSCP